MTLRRHRLGRGRLRRDRRPHDGPRDLLAASTSSSRSRPRTRSARIFSSELLENPTLLKASALSLLTIFLATTFGPLQRLLDTVELTRRAVGDLHRRGGARSSSWPRSASSSAGGASAGAPRRSRPPARRPAPRDRRRPTPGAADGRARSTAGSRLLLAAAMFVLVVDTSLMNVSISAVVTDLGTTVSGVQSAIALEALVSAAFILISSKVGDLIGRKKAYILGLLGYAVGALAMVLAQDLRAIIIFWAILGGLGASLLLPSMQSLIHGNFEGANQKRVYALVGASAAIAAAIGPLLGGFITTFLSWRVGFLLELVVIGVVLVGIGRIRDVPFTGERGIDLVGAVLSVLGMGGIVLGILVWQEGGEAVGPVPGRRRRRRWPRWPGGWSGASAQGKLAAARPRPVPLAALPAGHLRPDAPADRPGRRDDRPADLPADGPRVQRAAGRPVARAAVAEHVRRGHAGREARRQAPAGGASSASASSCS